MPSLVFERLALILCPVLVWGPNAGSSISSGKHAAVAQWVKALRYWGE